MSLFLFSLLPMIYWKHEFLETIPANICLDEDVLKTSLVFVFRRRLQDVLKTSWSRRIYSPYSHVFRRGLHQDQHICLGHTSSRRLQDVFNTSSRRLQDFFKTPSRRFQDVLKTSSRHLQDVLKTSSRRLQDISRRFQHVLSS